MKKITLFSILAVLFAAMSFTSCNSDSDNGIQLPTKQEAYNMMQTVAASSSLRIKTTISSRRTVLKPTSLSTLQTAPIASATSLLSC